MPEIPEGATPLGLLAMAILVMAWTGYRVLPGLLGRFKANGSERRVGMRDLQRDLADNRSQIDAIHHRFNQLEERSRVGDTQTARELGMLTATVQSLEGQIRVIRDESRSSPPDGNPTKPLDIKE